ncbi:MAG: 23S rRNA (guanosine(2251)-2'-O)-methyltransferase RlmB [Myxococcaceae bacterium]
MARHRAAPAARERRGPLPREQRRAAAPERVVYGIHPVLEALRAHPGDVERLLMVDPAPSSHQASEVLARAEAAGVRVERVPKERLGELATGGVHQGVLAELRAYAYAELQQLLALARASTQPPLLVVLDGIQDPHNLGAIIRSAYAFGAHGVVLGKDRAAGVTAAVAKASAGAVEHLRIARVTNLSRALEELKGSGLWVAAADPTGDTPLWAAPLDGPLAVVVGAEGEGVRPGLLGHSDFRLRIPVAPGMGALNASVAAALFLYEVARQRAKPAAPRAASS